MGTVSNSTKGVAVVTIGKICLQDALIAKKYLRVLVKNLETNANGIPAKVNSLVVLADLLVRFVIYNFYFLSLVFVYIIYLLYLSPANNFNSSG